MGRLVGHEFDLNVGKLVGHGFDLNVARLVGHGFDLNVARLIGHGSEQSMGQTVTDVHRQSSCSHPQGCLSKYRPSPACDGPNNWLLIQWLVDLHLGQICDYRVHL